MALLLVKDAGGIHVLHIEKKYKCATQQMIPKDLVTGPKNISTDCIDMSKKTVV